MNGGGKKRGEIVGAGDFLLSAAKCNTDSCRGPRKTRQQSSYFDTLSPPIIVMHCVAHSFISTLTPAFLAPSPRCVFSTHPTLCQDSRTPSCHDLLAAAWPRLCVVRAQTLPFLASHLRQIDSHRLNCSSADFFFLRFLWRREKNACAGYASVALFTVE